MSKVAVNEQSNVVEMLVQTVGHLFAADILPDEHRHLLGVLEHAGHLDRASPVHVVEALRVNELLDDPLFQVGVAIKDFVEGGLDGAAVALLGH